MIAIDTNLLVYAHRSTTSEHKTARKAIEKAAALGEWGFSMPCISEFFSVVTHPACPPRPSTQREAVDYIDALVEGGAEIWMPGPGFGMRLLKTAKALHVSGHRIFDLQIAMMAFESGATEIWSHDRNFQTVPGLSVVDPLMR